MDRICVTCGKPRAAGRRECKSCYRKSAARRSRERYYAGNGKNRTHYSHCCPACGVSYITTHKDAYLCSTCSAKAKHASRVITRYAYSHFAKGRLVWQHRAIAESVIGRRLYTNEVVHHIDGDKSHNDLSNLIVMPCSEHAKLHHYLGKQRVIYERSEKEDPKDHWNTLVLPLTIAWLEMAGTRVIKLWKLDN